MKARKVASLVVVALIAIGAGAGPAGAIGAGPGIPGDPNPGVVPRNSTAFGTTYRDLAGAWWQWALAGDASDNPVLDPTGANCAVRQSGKVWVLAGTFGGTVTRSCPVPAGQALFFPVLNTVWAANPGESATEDELAALVLNDLQASTAIASIDGASVQNIGLYLAISPAFSLALGENNVLGAPAGIYTPAVGGGIQLLLAPLSRGSHTIEFEGCFANGNCFGATYHLTVGG